MEVWRAQFVEHKDNQHTEKCDRFFHQHEDALAAVREFGCTIPDPHPNKKEPEGWGWHRSSYSLKRVLILRIRIE